MTGAMPHGWRWGAKLHNCIHSEADGDVDGDADGVGDVDSDPDSDGDAAVIRCIPCKLHVMVKAVSK